MASIFKSPRKPVQSALVFLTILSTVWFSAIPASSQGTQDSRAQELQRLKDKVQQMEQQIQQINGQIDAIQNSAQQPAAAAAPPPAAAVPAATGPTAQPAQAELEAREPPEASEAVDAAHNPVPAGTFSAYGFAQLDAGYNFGQIDPDWYDTMRPTKLAASKNEFAPNGTVFFSVRQTRFGVKTSTPTKFGDLKTIFEFELFGTGVDAGQTTFRLRHAWGELGQFGGGQTWSLFMDPDVFPNSLEYWGPNGMVFFRNIQFRWMPIKKGDSHLWIDVERPGASADGGTYSDRIELSNVRPKFDLPDFAIQGHFARGWGYVQIASIFRKISWQQLGPTTNPNPNGTLLGWGINGSSNLKLGKHDVLKLQAVYGDGIENYMNDAPADVALENDLANRARPVKAVALPVLGTVTFLDHTWNDKFQSTIGYSFVNIDNANGQNLNDFHQGDYALTNLTYYPVKNVMFGGEFQYGRRVNFSDGFNVNDYKLQFSAKFSYSRIVPY